jgi:hypothetical protein
LLTVDTPVVGEDAIVELAHDALLEQWKDLSLWLDQRWEKLLYNQAGHAHVAEMARRRRLALPRSTPGRVFSEYAGPDDGRYCWTIIDQVLFEKILAKLAWGSASGAPGLRARRAKIGDGEKLSILFRLRGLTERGLAAAVTARATLIGEYWPNSQGEGFRGITLVDASSRSWRQDLVPTADGRVFILTIRKGALWLDQAK